MKFEYLKENELIHGSLYFVDSRNSFVGIWDANKKEFLQYNYKFGKRDTDTDYHVDGEKHGTVKPLCFLEIPEPELLSCREEREYLYKWHNLLNKILDTQTRYKRDKNNG